MVPDDPVNVMVRHVGQRYIVALQKTQPGIIVMEIKSPPHPLRHLVDKTEYAVVAAGAVLIHQPALKSDPQVLRRIFLDLQFPVFIPFADHDQQFFFLRQIPVVEYILYLLVIDGDQKIPRFYAEFFSDRSGRDRCYLMIIVLTFGHIRYILILCASAIILKSPEWSGLLVLQSVQFSLR